VKLDQSEAVVPCPELDAGLSAAICLLLANIGPEPGQWGSSKPGPSPQSGIFDGPGFFSLPFRTPP